MHASRARSLKWGGRDHSPSMKQPAVVPSVCAWGSQPNASPEGLWYRPSSDNDLALLACINYMRRSGSQSGKLSGRADWRWLTLHLSHIFDELISKIYCEVIPCCSISTIYTILDKLWYWNINSDFIKLVMLSILNVRHLVTTWIRPTL